ncbi:hypothetical protein GGR57DRAFT_515448 [Xylariaceae sp. FL1272]|nr:hypothetical protein GGR57DRAFT_515448 [Xylariaceae sp. FL1272]
MAPISKFIAILATFATATQAVVVDEYGGDDCTGQLNSYDQSAAGSYGCYPVPSGKRSIFVSGVGCTVTTYSGVDCGGSTLDISGGSCLDVLYGSISIACNSTNSRPTQLRYSDAHTIGVYPANDSLK